MPRILAFAAAIAVMLGQPVAAQEAGEAPATSSQWITLGTDGGPIPKAARSQPANLLQVGGENYLVDVGDGAVVQMARAGVPLLQLDGVFISHLHFDHTGGLAAVLGLRFQTDTPGVLTIYGPPGTRALVDGIVASMQPSAQAGYGIPGEQVRDPAETVRVVEWRGGESVTVGAMHVRTAANTHYSFTEDSPQFGQYFALSFRFDTPDRDIVYTGDTGPSPAVDALGAGADLLVAEMIDVDALLASMGPARGDAGGGPPPLLIQHLRRHHLTPEDIGAMAAAMGVSQVVVTHLVIGNAGNDELLDYVARIRAAHPVPVVIATDLARF